MKVYKVIIPLIIMLILVSCPDPSTSSASDPPTPSGFVPGISFTGELPNGIDYDLYRSISATGPAGAGISDTTSEYTTYSETASSLSSNISGSNGDFAYSGHATLSDSAITGNIYAEGNGLSGYDEYGATGNLRYYFYFTAESSLTETEYVRVNLPFSVSETLSIEHGRDYDYPEYDYLKVFGTGSFKTTLYSMREVDGSNPEGRATGETSYAIGSILQEVLHRGKITYDNGTWSQASAGIFEGDISANAESASLSGSGNASFSVVPGNMYCLMLTLYVSSHIDCWGAPGYEVWGRSNTHIQAHVDWDSLALADPDRDSAQIALKIHCPAWQE
ncbi:MAG: hypothetical protein JXA95_15745 [Spirochaetales bacterium]|nr:hypothetical protein [Spirochaetales bacterium]